MVCNRGYQSFLRAAKEIPLSREGGLLIIYIPFWEFTRSGSGISLDGIDPILSRCMTWEEGIIKYEGVF